MLNRFQGWRERGWSPVDASTYASAWQRFGGSVATHPLVVERLADLAGIPVRYLAWEQGGEVKAAIPTWGRDLALSKDVLKRNGKKGLFDLGNAEVILPAAEDVQIVIQHSDPGVFALLQGQAPALYGVGIASGGYLLSLGGIRGQRDAVRRFQKVGVALHLQAPAPHQPH